MGRKVGAAVLLLGCNWVPIQHNMAGTEAYLRAKFLLDPPNRLVTIHQRDRQDRQQTDRTGQDRQRPIA